MPVGTTNAASTPTTLPATSSLLGFPGQLRTLPDLYYNQYRDYDPTTGRYIQADPIGLDGDINPYAYARGNPVGRADPMGLEIGSYGPDGRYYSPGDNPKGNVREAYIALAGMAIILPAALFAPEAGPICYGNLFARNGQGLLNRNNFIRIGEGWKGSNHAGRRVFRIAIGHKSWPKIPHLPGFPWHIP